MIATQMTWEDRWVVHPETKVRSGGQGNVTKVLNRKTHKFGALKRMHPEHQRDSERRQRMAREVRALEKLRGDHIPAVLDHNMASVSSVDEPLFFVTEWIEGKTLQDMFGGRPCDLREALTITRDLVEIIGRCHDSEVIHRDIKPSNIIIRPETSALMLLDFGIAYSDAPEETLKTEIRQELGNRFLRLPGLAAGGPKRDSRDDLTMAVGMLFFLITGHAPRPNQLLDDNGRLPHQRQSDPLPEKTVANPIWRRVKSVFDVGFNVNVGFRFQQASELVERIDEALNYDPSIDKSSPSYEQELEALDALRKQIDAAVDEVEQSLIDALNLLLTELRSICKKNKFAPAYPMAKISQYGREAQMLWAVHLANSEDPKVFVNLYVTLEGVERSYVSISIRESSAKQKREALYRGLAADVERLKEEAIRVAPEAFSFGVRLLRTKAEIIQRNRVKRSEN